jgi:Alpha/beta hydrolase domain
MNHRPIRNQIQDAEVRLRIYKKGIAVTAVLAALIIFPDSIPLSAATPLPVVHGPLPVTADSYPFGAADHTRVPTDLKKLGYVEEEFLAEGKANIYEWPAQGAAVIRTASAPYTTSRC